MSKYVFLVCMVCSISRTLAITNARRPPLRKMPRLHPFTPLTFETPLDCELPLASNLKSPAVIKRPLSKEPLAPMEVDVDTE